jgi:hypothetical protein
MADNARQTGAAVEAQVAGAGGGEKFPRTQKFLIADRIRTTTLDVLACPIEATYTRDQKDHSTFCSAESEVGPTRKHAALQQVGQNWGLCGHGIETGDGQRRLRRRRIS